VKKKVTSNQKDEKNLQVSLLRFWEVCWWESD